MSKRLLVLISVTIAASMLLAACGGGGAAAGKTLKIVSSLPMTGSSLTQTQTMVNAEKLAFEQAKNSACGGKYTLVYEAWDDASAAQGKWDAAVETENANKAAADKSIVAYLGTFNSGAAKLSIPILNQAGPLVMVSPANTYPGLTHSAPPLTLADEPAKYFPSGTRNYARTCTTDDIQGPAAVEMMTTKLGVKTLYIVNDQEVYGKGVADSVENSAKAAGITVIANEGFDPKAADYKALMTKISTSNAGGPPDMVYIGAIIDNNAAQVLKDKVAIMGDNTKVKFMGPDGIYTQALIDGAGAGAEGAYATTPGLMLKDLGPNGLKFRSDYEAKYGPLTEPYAVLAYDAAGVVLKAIEGVCAAGGDPSDRATLTKAVMATKDYDGALGKWSFNENGDTTLKYILVGQVTGGKFADYATVAPK